MTPIYSDSGREEVLLHVVVQRLQFHVEEFSALSAGEEGFLGEAGGDGKVSLVDDGAQAKLFGIFGSRVQEPISNPHLPFDDGEAPLLGKSFDLIRGEPELIADTREGEPLLGFMV